MLTLYVIRHYLVRIVVTLRAHQTWIPKASKRDRGLQITTGEYDGAGAIERAFNDYKAGKITRTGIMVHYVIVKVDRGDPIMVREITFQEDDDLDKVEERIHSYEHELIVDATAKVVREILQKRSGS